MIYRQTNERIIGNCSVCRERRIAGIITVTQFRRRRREICRRDLGVHTKQVREYWNYICYFVNFTEKFDLFIEIFIFLIKNILNSDQKIIYFNKFSYQNYKALLSGIINLEIIYVRNLFIYFSQDLRQEI